MEKTKITTIIFLIALFGLFEIFPIEIQAKESAIIKDSPILSKNDFMEKMRAHIDRVERLGVQVFNELKNRYPDQFGKLKAQDVRNFLRLHDKTKLDQSPRFLKIHGLVDKPRIADTLSEFYGLSKDQLEKMPGHIIANGTRFDDLKYTVDLLNKVDNEVAESFLKGMPELAKEQLRLIEKVADGVDTAMSRANEFSHNVLPASEFFSKQLSTGNIHGIGDQGQHLVEMSQFLEKKSKNGFSNYELFLRDSIYCPLNLLQMIAQ